MSNQNPFSLLTDDPVNFNAWSLKSKLIIILRDMVKENGWTQQEAADVLGISQPRVSNMLQGRIDKFSIDMLYMLLFKLGFSSELTYTPDNRQEPLSVKLKRAVL
ncbi:helix-turn-helix domain-containing protein [Aeromonas hydrophila]|jgi:predicted XRE-type DNA-binding protein